MGTWIRVIVGSILTVIGLVWIGQGLNIIPGSTMTGDTKWAIIGTPIAIVGLVLTIGGFRKRGQPKS